MTLKLALLQLILFILVALANAKPLIEAENDAKNVTGFTLDYFKLCPGPQH